MFWPSSNRSAAAAPSSTEKRRDHVYGLNSQATLEIAKVTSYENVSQKFVSFINSLREIGAESFVDLPRICVAGNQSVGKSSLLEGISGIRLPRGDGTCTRCVIEIRMRSKLDEQDEWACNIKLVHRRNNSLEVDQPIHFATTSDPESVQDLVRRAQKALLNPSDSKNELLFTESSVIIDIAGSTVDLSLIDLPGVIKSVQNSQDQHLITLIESVIQNYISKPKTLILAVFTCKDDMENQAVFRMARQVDPTGERTIGVLTKPDTIEKGTHERWLKVLNGDLYYLKLGYFVVKMPSKEETVSGVDILEQDFFKSSPVWNGLHVRLADRLGISSLREVLGSLLTQLIESSIPSLKQATQESLVEVNRALDSLPPAPGGDAKVELLQTFRHYSTLVSYHINAQQNLKVFNQKVKKHYEAFKDSVLATRPKLVARKLAASSPVTSTFWKRSTTPTDSPPKQPSSLSKGEVNCFTIEDLKNIVVSQKGHELEGHAPYGAFENLIKRSQSDWKSLVTALISNIAAELDNLTGKLLQEVFGRFPNLRVHIRNLVHILQANLQQNTRDMTGHTLLMESRHPFTLASTAFLNGKQQELDNLQQSFPASEYMPLNPERADAAKRALSALGEAGIRGITSQTLMARISPQTSDSYLLDLMASSVSYFDISAARFMDNACLQIDYHFLLAFTEILEKEMIEGLGILRKSDNELTNLLLEEGGIAKRRSKLISQRSKLEEIYKRLIFGLA